MLLHKISHWGTISDKLMRMSCVTSNLFLCFVLILAMVENPFSHKKVVGKSNSFFIALIESSGYSLYTTHQKSTTVSFFNLFS